MLELILSGAGGGKTTAVLQALQTQAEAGGNRLTLLVPEQFSFTCQKLLLARMPAQTAARIDVLSFTALAEKLVGAPALHARRRLDEAASVAMMATALANVRDRLQLYGRHTARRSVITEFAALRSEFKRSGVSAEELRAAASTLGSGLLQWKLEDLATVFDAYDALLGSSFFDPDDLLTACADRMDAGDYFRGRQVYLDGFRGFTAQELRVIGGMLCRAERVCVTLCCDSLAHPEDATDRFAHTKRTAMRLIRLAQQNHVTVLTPQVLAGGRPVAPALAELEKNLYAPAPEVYAAPCPELLLCKAADVASECAFVAATAKRMIREEGLRCREIAVIARNAEVYEAPLRAALEKCGIGAFEDRRQPVDASPVVNFAESAVEIAAEGFRTETVMRYLKTGLTPFTTEEISELENYSYIWQVDGGGWCRPWSRNPRGFGQTMTDADAETLAWLNALRERLVIPLLTLRDALATCTGASGARAVYDFLERIDARTQVRALGEACCKAGELGAAIELDRLWTVLIEQLDSIETLLRDRTVSAAEFGDTLTLMLSAQTVGSLPQGLDEITIGAADRIRTVAPKVTFLVGCNSGVFPAVPGGGAALTDRDRRVLESMGITLAGFGEHKLAEERLIAYSAMCSPSARLIICCPERGANGESLAPSELYLKVRALFPQCAEVDAAQQDALYYAEGAAPAFEQLAKARAQGGVTYASFRAAFAKDPAWAGRLAALDRAAGGRDYRIEDPAVATALFGRQMRISASRVEKYHQCPFAYFCSYGLRVRPRRIAALDPMQRGNVIHAMLEALLRAHPGEALTALRRPEIAAFLHDEMARYLRETLGEEPLSPQFLYLYETLEAAVCDVAVRLIEELRNSDFVPVDFELRIGGEDPQVPAYTLGDSACGVRISGAVDRVDTAVINGKPYLRVVDYKSSGKKFRLSDAMQGLNLQMLLYLFALWQNGTARYGAVTPAGVLYYPAKAPRLSMPRDATEHDILNETRRQCRTEGLLLRDTDVVLAMDRTACGLYVPAEFKKDGLTGSLIGLRQLARLKQRADEILLQMARDLQAGSIPALPAQGVNYPNVCQYCDYQTVCGYEPEIPVRTLVDTDAQAVLRELDGEEVPADAVDSGSTKGH